MNSLADSCSDPHGRFTDSPDRLAGLVPAIHEPRHSSHRFPWIPGTRPGMTVTLSLYHLNGSKH
jgi:hypothetical protein